jgi:hypothetical protein
MDAMRKIIAGVLMVSMINLLISCGDSSLRIDDPPIGESVEIKLVDGSSRRGVILKKEGNKLLYMDADSQKPEDLDVKKVKAIVKAGKIYDLQGKEITEAQIDEVKGSSKMWAYGLGGFVLGAAVGFGVAAIANSQDADIAPIYPMAGLGVLGGVYFGIQGSESDRQDAIDEIRESRYQDTQVKLKQRLEDEKKRLQEQQKKQEELKKDIQKKEE